MYNKDGLQRMQDDTHTFLKKEKGGHNISYEDGTMKERLRVKMLWRNRFTKCLQQSCK